MTLKQQSEIETRFMVVIMLMIAIMLFQIATMFLIDNGITKIIEEIRSLRETTIIVPPTQYIPPPRQLQSDC